MHDICRDTSVVQFEGILSNDNKYWEKLISIDKEVGTCICKKEKNKKVMLKIWHMNSISLFF